MPNSQQFAGFSLEIGKRIRELRVRRTLSQGDIRRATGMSRPYISSVESGHTIPSLESIERFAGALGVPVHEMFLIPSESAIADLASRYSPFLRLLMIYIHSDEQCGTKGRHECGRGAI
jgi:transcriptional regulator with XRE-family HTH domain